MEVIVHIGDEVYDYLQEQSRKSGKSVEDLIVSIIKSRVSEVESDEESYIETDCNCGC